MRAQASAAVCDEGRERAGEQKGGVRDIGQEADGVERPRDDELRVGGGGGGGRERRQSRLLLGSQQARRPVGAGSAPKSGLGLRRMKTHRVAVIDCERREQKRGERSATSEREREGGARTIQDARKELCVGDRCDESEEREEERGREVHGRRRFVSKKRLRSGLKKGS